MKIRLKELVEEKGISLLQLHKITGIRYATLSELANHKRQSIQFDYIERILDALDIPLTEMHVLFEVDKSKKFDKTWKEVI